MVQFTTTISKFGQQGEKTGWTHIMIPAAVAQKIFPGNKKSFRVKGMLDEYPVEKVALMPMGEGDFVMPLNAAMRKGIRKAAGDKLNVKLELDKNPINPPQEFIECLKDEPAAYKFFFSLAKSHQLYFTRWIQSAKTEQTKAKRIAQAINALAKGLYFGLMMRAIKKERDELGL